jgi:signal transduction histidine kinase
MDEVRGSSPRVGTSAVSDESAQPDPGSETELTGTARALLQAFVSISSDLDTHSVLSRIVTSACELTGAGHGALGVLDHDGGLADVVTHGMSSEQAASIRELPTGQGLLGDPTGSLLVAPIRVRGTAFGTLFLTGKKNRDRFDKHDEMLVQSLAGVAGFVIENARAYGISERRRRWLEMFGELTELLTPPITPASALERIASALLDASGAQSSSVVQVPEDGTPFATAVCGEPLDLQASDEKLFAEAVRTVVGSGEILEIVVQEEWVAVLAPLRAHLTMPGVLILTHPRLGRPDALEERQLLSSFADQAALALDRTQALEDREQMAVVSDRDRIARDLHDVVIQRLFATGLHMQSIRAAAPNEELRQRIDKCVTDLDQTIRDIRGTIFELQTRPRSSIRSDVRDVVQEVLPQLGFPPSVETTGPVDTPINAELQQQLVTVLREALSNVARHAKATSASVQLQVTDSHLRLKVSDDGVGIPEERTELGLRNVRRRAALLGGNLDLWPNEPSGTIFVWSVPLPDQPSRQD